MRRSALSIAFAALVLFVLAACTGGDARHGGDAHDAHDGGDSEGGDVLVPRITLVSPDRGPQAGGTTVTLTISNRTDGAPNGLAVFFGAVAATHVRYVNATTITCVTPAAAMVGSVDVTVSDDRQSFSLESGFRYHSDSELTVTSVSPASSPTGTTQPVTLAGSFDTTVPATVQFGSVAATQVAVVNATTLTARRRRARPPAPSR